MSTKKFSILAIILLTFSITSVSAQDIPPQPTTKKVRFGLFAAPTISWMHPKSGKSEDQKYAVQSEGSKAGFMYGLMIDYKLAKNLSLATGLQMDMTGGKIMVRNLGNSTQASVVNLADFNYHLSYAEIPLGLKFNTNPIEGFRFFGQIGASLGINVGKKATYEVSYSDATAHTINASSKREKIKGTLAIAPAMIQMNIGGGAEYMLTKNLSAYAGIFYNNGFWPDATNPQKYNFNSFDNLTFSDGKVHLNNIAFKVGFLF